MGRCSRPQLVGDGHGGVVRQHQSRQAVLGRQVAGLVPVEVCVKRVAVHVARLREFTVAVSYVGDLDLGGQVQGGTTSHGCR